MKKLSKSSKNVVSGTPFTAAQQASLGQTAQSLGYNNLRTVPTYDETLRYASPGTMFPMPSQTPNPPSPFEVLAEHLKQQETTYAMGMGDVNKKMDEAAARDKMRTRMEKRTRWGNATTDINGNIVPKELLRKTSKK